MLNRKIIWFGRIALLFSILSFLCFGYLWGFVRLDTLKMNMFFIGALINGIMLFLTFPISGIDTQFNRLKKQFFKNSDFNNAYASGLSCKKQVIIIFIIVFIAINTVLGLMALNLSNHIKMISHMIIAIISTFVFTNFLLTSKINETFKKLEDLISELKKDQTTDEKRNRENT